MTQKPFTIKPSSAIVIALAALIVLKFWTFILVNFPFVGTILSACLGAYLIILVLALISRCFTGGTQFRRR